MNYVVNKIIFGIILMIISSSISAQNAKIKLDPIEAEILLNYYAQDGNNSAVTGGQGTEELKNYASVIAIRIPTTALSNLSIKAGVDAYTSASSGNIDLYSTGASSGNGRTADSEKDVRKHFNIGYSETLTSSELNFDAGYSTEYDVNSINAGIGYSKFINKKNQKLSLAANAFIDRWLLIYPGEIRNANNNYYYHDDRFNTLRDGDYDDNEHSNMDEERLNKDDFNSDIRYTFNVNLGFQSVINRRSNFSLILDYTKQSGLLHTPFHRVYFDDGEADIEDKLVKVENLPREKNKIAIGTRYNHFLTSNIIARMFYRFYIDDFGTSAHAFSLEIPIKIGQTWTLYPFVRFYNQSENNYFQPFGMHNINATYFTSDYDLSGFSSFHRGLSFKIAPSKGLLKIGKHFGIKEFKIRYSHYNRTTDLVADNITFATKFNF